MLKKSQVTLFLLIGLLMVVVFGFLFYTSNIVAKTKIEKRAEKVTADLLETTALKYYVTSCLEDSLKNGLKLLGEQGGFLYKDQDSVIDWDIPYVAYDHDNDGIPSRVAYQIYSSTIQGQIKDRAPNPASPPFYPCLVTGPSDLVGQTCYETYNHDMPYIYFGTTGEPNKTISPQLCSSNIILSGFEYKCSCSGIQCSYSIQAQLESFIEARTAKCVNFSSFTNYNVTTGDIKANVTFGENDVSVDIDFPITVIIKGYQPVVRVLNFYAEKQVRLKKVFDFVFRNNNPLGLIQSDIKYVAFRIKEDSLPLTNDPRYKGISVDVDRISISDKNVDIIRLTDSKSFIDGKNYTFMFTRENRRPALDYFEDASPPPGYDMYVITGGKIDFSQAAAFDPDEDELEFEYNVLEDAKWDATEAAAIKSALDTNSYYETSLVGDDDGEHYIIIVAKEKENNLIRDWQNVSILVDDNPDVKIKTDNFYDDVDNKYASIEDIFFIDLSGSLNLYGGELEYRWDDSIEDACDSNPFTYSLTNKIYFPSQGANINNVDGCFDITGKHNLTVQARSINPQYQGAVGIGVKQIDVEQCLPHRRINSSPYPFHNYDYDLYTNDTIDKFQADHTCCRDDSIKYTSGDNKECYNLVDYGCITHLDPETGSNSDYYSYLASLGLNPNQRKNFLPDSERDNLRDVYKRTLIRKCDGLRGNTCSGAYTYEIEYIKTCPAVESKCCWHAYDEASACGQCPNP